MGTIFVDAGFGFEGYTGGAQDRRRLGTAISIGDTGFIDEDGYVYISGRDDDMIVSGGENIYPSEVEAALDEMPELTEAAVIGVDDEEYGQVLHAICVKRAGARVDEAAVIEHVRQRLSRYKAPKRVTFIDELPRNSTGKVLKRELQLIVAATRGDDGRAVRPGRRPRRVPAGKDKA